MSISLTDAPGLNDSRAASRRDQSLLYRGYRQAKRRKDYGKALEFAQAGDAMGLPVGRPVRSEEIAGRGEARYEARMDAMGRRVEPGGGLGAFDFRQRGYDAMYGASRLAPVEGVSGERGPAGAPGQPGLMPRQIDRRAAFSRAFQAAQTPEARAELVQRAQRLGVPMNGAAGSAGTPGAAASPNRLMPTLAQAQGGGAMAEAGAGRAPGMLGGKYYPILDPNSGTRQAMTELRRPAPMPVGRAIGDAFQTVGRNVFQKQMTDEDARVAQYYKDNPHAMDPEGFYQQKHAELMGDNARLNLLVGRHQADMQYDLDERRAQNNRLIRDSGTPAALPMGDVEADLAQSRKQFGTQRGTTTPFSGIPLKGTGVRTGATSTFQDAPDLPDFEALLKKKKRATGLMPMR